MTNQLILRPAEPADVPVLFQLIQALAEYEKLSHAVTGTAEALKNHLFGKQPYAEAILVESGGQAVGFALFLHNYSTFLTKPGIYLEDLFVLPEYRRQGIGKALLTYLAQLAVERDCGRLEWSVLDWNEPAISFYRRMGATIREDGRICRVTDEVLTQLSAGDVLARVRSAEPPDVPVLFEFIQGKAEFDQQLPALSGNSDSLKEHLFGSQPYVEAILAESEGQAVGFAVFFHNYSTFLTKPGIFVDDLFLIPEYRRQGIGTAILTHLAKIATQRNCGRIEWLVSVANEPAIAFYQRLGASVLPDWRICRVTGLALTQLAAER